MAKPKGGKPKKMPKGPHMMPFGEMMMRDMPKKGGKLGRRARLAKTLKKLKK